jgi:pilus assembly protein Flp/PilA
MWTKLNHLVLSLVTRAQVMREEGQALVEYTLILALVSIVAIALLTTIGGDIQKVLEEVVKGLEKA